MAAFRCAVLVGVILRTQLASCDIGCRDNKGLPVDWFVVYKLPHIKHSRNATVKSGFGQLYMDVNNQQWTLLDEPINSTNHAIYFTLQQIYKGYQAHDVAYLMYNDETPAGHQSTNHGHTKGDVCFDKTSGFWLVHSVPKFPPLASDQYSYPLSGAVFGQTFLCVTYPYKTFNAIGKQLLYNYPQFYSHHLPDEFVSDNEYVYLALNGTRISASPWNISVILLSSGQQQFISFAKFTNYQQDLYDAWVVSYLSAELYVETWMNGAGPLPSNCTTKYHVLNVRKLNISGEYFKNSEDHSKWAVTNNGDWICIGDINREVSQKHRAGGTVCSFLPRIATAFQNSIVDAEKCDQYEFIQNRFKSGSDNN